MEIRSTKWFLTAAILIFVNQSMHCWISRTELRKINDNAWESLSIGGMSYECRRTFSKCLKGIGYARSANDAVLHYESGTDNWLGTVYYISIAFDLTPFQSDHLCEAYCILRSLYLRAMKALAPQVAPTNIIKETIPLSQALQNIGIWPSSFGFKEIHSFMSLNIRHEKNKKANVANEYFKLKNCLDHAFINWVAYKLNENGNCENFFDLANTWHRLTKLLQNKCNGICIAEKF